MKYGVVMWTGIEPRELLEVARETEEAGWDGFFIWDASLSDNAWLLLAAIAVQTRRIRLGTMLTAPSRRRPWQLASEVATLDRLSNGRAILPLGLGVAKDPGFANVGEETDRRIRAERLDESIDILSGLSGGERFSYEGKHYRLRNVRLAPSPLQSPRVPIWVVGAWPRMKSMRRVLRCDGLIPVKMTPEGAAGEVTPADIRAMKVWVDERRTLATPFDIVYEGETPGEDRERTVGIVRAWADAGVTWWLESAAAHHRHGGMAAARARITRGPPHAV